MESQKKSPQKLRKNGGIGKSGSGIDRRGGKRPGYGLVGYWSRRSNDEHRLVYKVTEDACFLPSSATITSKPVTQKNKEQEKAPPACTGSPGQPGIFSELTPCRKRWDSDKQNIGNLLVVVPAKTGKRDPTPFTNSLLWQAGIKQQL